MIALCDSCGAGFAPDADSDEICPRCAYDRRREQIREAALRRNTPQKRTHLRDRPQYVDGGWHQLGRGNCERCPAKDVWLYRPVKKVELTVCGRCAQVLGNRGLPLDADVTRGD